MAFVVDVFGRLADLLRGSTGAALRRRLGATPDGPQHEFADEQLHVASFSAGSPDERTDHLGIGAGGRTLPPATLCHWIARVGRFSFDLGDVNGSDAGAATARSNVSRVRAASAKCAAACTPA